MPADDRPALEITEIEVTPEMVRAALNVDWVQEYQFEFGLEDEPERMRPLIEELWHVMSLARGTERS